MIKTIFLYLIIIVLTLAIFGVETGIVEIKNPNKVVYEKSKHWTVED